MDRKPIASSLRPAYSWGRARVAELVDAPDLGSGAFGCAGPVDTGPFPMGRLRDGQAERWARPLGWRTTGPTAIRQAAHWRDPPRAYVKGLRQRASGPSSAECVRKRSAIARNALPRCEIAFFCASVNSARVRPP